ncbi:hypothetical protein PybrP1_011658 [[Pythium] brassicae (nom. inval.)]|nr:hypothetical protein PybrP1_011658 [[Pythium] brassicae (nom. inval.)]
MSDATPLDELEPLRAALLATDAPTRAFLSPLLPLRAVQQVLLSFVRDRSRRFEDWVWDPRVRQLLDRLRAQEPTAHHHAQDVDRWFDRATQDQRAFEKTHFLAAADAAQRDGKAKFQSRDYYAAANAFRKSLASLAAHATQQQHGGGDGELAAAATATHTWEPELQERYVTLCNNVAVCGLKMSDLSLIREFAQKALAVNAASSKALYATAKLRLLEHRHDDALAAVERALAHEPANQLLVKFHDEIERARANEAKEQALIAALAKVKLEEAEAARQQEAARQKAWDETRVTAADFVPLPELHDEARAAVNINTYFMRVKQKLQVEIAQLHDPECSELPLFECTMTNGATGAVLAAGVRGSSKKLVKNEAAKVAIKRLWALKTEAGTLLEEDRAYLAQHEQAQRDGVPVAESAHTHSRVAPTATATATALEGETDLPLSSSGAPSVKISAYERSLDTVMLLNQLHQQKRLHVLFELEDVQPDSKGTPEFRCVVQINGEPLGDSAAPNKKKARADAAKQAFAAALEQKIVFYWDPPEDSDET